MRKILIIISLLFFFLTACEKETKIQKKVLGEWYFQTIRIEVNTDSIGFHSKDTVYYSGKILKGSNDSEFIIQYTGDSSVTATVNSDGTLSNLYHHLSRGNFSEDYNKINISLYWGGLMVYVHYQIIGEKQN